MRVRHGILGLVVLGLAVSQLAAQSIDQTGFFRRPAKTDCTNCPVTVIPSTIVHPPAQPGTAPKADTAPKAADPAPKVDQAPMLDSQAFAQAPAGGGEAGASFNPAMFGDLGASGAGSLKTSIRSSSSSTSSPVAASAGSSSLRVPLVSRGAFKISDNESPRPTDRVFFGYNYYERVSLGDGTSLGLHRELIGFEKTFLDGYASFGARLPFMHFSDVSPTATGLANSQIGDLTLIGKYALYNDQETGNLISAGLAVTLDTADRHVVLSDGSTFRSTLFQPFVGWIFKGDFLYAHAFHAVVFPTNSRDITVVNNDVAIGAFVYRNEESFIRAIVPTIEGHLFTPLENRGLDNPALINATDIFTGTVGVNIVFPGNSTLGVGVAAPLTGPRPNNVEALASFNFRF